MESSEAASVAASDRYGAERGQRNRCWSHTQVEAPDAIRGLEAIEALIIDLHAFGLEICGLLKSSDEAALYRESASDIGPTVAAKVLVHLFASKISALIGLIRHGIRRRRQTSGIEDLLDHDRIEVGPPPLVHTLSGGGSSRPLPNKTETSMDAEPFRRQGGTMLPDSKTATIRSPGRINLRLPAETYGVIDIARAARPGNISRNSWITEAVEEKLARHRAESGELKGSEINA
jgi:hypothetical protein